jgi:phosphohistidine phosphatase
MKVFLLRHAEAVEREDTRDKTDAARQLTAKGQQRAKQLAHTLRQMHVQLDAIYSSPLVRARETADIVAHGLRLTDQLEITPHLAPDGDMGELFNQVNQLRPVPTAVLFVGHEPYLSTLISLLCTGDGQLGLTLKKCGLCRLEVEMLRLSRCANLEWLITSRWVGAKRAKSGGHTPKRKAG